MKCLLILTLLFVSSCVTTDSKTMSEQAQYVIENCYFMLKAVMVDKLGEYKKWNIQCDGVRMENTGSIPPLPDEGVQL